MLVFLIVVAIIILALVVLAVIKKHSSVYKNVPSEQNPMEGKKVIFVENNKEPENADGARGHLEAVGRTKIKKNIYDRVIKRVLDAILSFLGLIILSPAFLVLCIAIYLDDPGPIFFSQKRVGRNKQYFRLHKFRSMNVFAIKENKMLRQAA